MQLAGSLATNVNDPANHCWQVFANPVGIDTQDPDAIVGQPRVSDRIASYCELVGRAIDFNAEFDFGAIEIKDIAASRVLPSKSKSGLFTLKFSPKLSLRSGHALTQAPRHTN
jgi:hypothetical protein